MKRLKITASVIVLLLFFNTMFSQNKWSAEFRPGIDFTTEAFGDAKLKTGFGFEVALSYKITQHISAYLGWGFNTFQSDDAPEIDFDATGYTFGLQLIHPIKKGSKLSYLLRAGGVYNHIEIENNNTGTIQDSDHRLGYEFGVGFNYILGSNGWSLRPQIGYRTLSSAVKKLNTKTELALNFIVFALGVSKTF